MNSNIATQKKGGDGKTVEETASKSGSRKLSSSVVVMEELSNEMVPDVSDLSSQFENVET